MFKFRTIIYIFSLLVSTKYSRMKKNVKGTCCWIKLTLLLVYFRVSAWFIKMLIFVADKRWWPTLPTFISCYVYTKSLDLRWVQPQSGQTKDYKIGICCFSAKHAALRSKKKDWLARNQNNVSDWSGLLFQWASIINIQLSVLF
jgi:hypothetical protein